MKVMWCWRCRMELPMLDEDEFAVVSRARTAGMDAGMKLLADEAAARGLPAPRPPPPDAGGVTRWLWPLCAGYEMFTGMEETNPNAVPHHRISIYGPSCEQCGKPLRTPRARYCPACGWGMDRLAASTGE